jgi:hypothetical protein
MPDTPIEECDPVVIPSVAGALETVDLFDISIHTLMEGMS